MISFFYEGDLVRFGDGIIIEKRVRKTPFFSDFLCDLYLDKKKYQALVRFPKFGGYAVKDILDNKDEALDYTLSRLKGNADFMARFYIRWALKLIMRFTQTAMPVFFILMYKAFDTPQRISYLIFMAIMELVLYYLGGLLNRM